MEDRFNLFDEQWIPIPLKGKASLRQVFTDETLESIGGTAIQKLAILKLLLAIGQTAATPEDNDDWKQMGAQGLGKKCIHYLEEHRNLFFLYGEKPFLQFPSLKKNKEKHSLQERDIGTNYLPDLPSDNNTIINSFQTSHPLSDSDKAVFIVSIMNYSLGGKRTDKNSPIFTPGFATKKGSAKPGPSLGNYNGYLQTCFQGKSILETVWLNLLSRENINSFFPQTCDMPIVPPWEKMPSGEDDKTARQLKSGLMGTLCGMCRFVYLDGDGIIYTDGIQYPSHKDGWREPFMAFSNDEPPKVAWVDTSKRPWRNLSALLELSLTNTCKDINCPQISMLFRRNCKAINEIGIFSGGLKVRANSGDQSVKQTDDFVDDSTFLTTSILNEEWFSKLKQEMNGLEELSKILYSSINKYWAGLKSGSSKAIAANGSEAFWDSCNSIKQCLFEKVQNDEKLRLQRKQFSDIAFAVYNNFCPKDTAKQILQWAESRPSFSKYLALEEEETIDA
ncbi:MAG: type I-E CRISPR-associated protein Cse1/CasA [Sphaerochaetaceae bacterium]|nr:type I-E CRISPR-associated protein Cse1/CasA [Candidatus Cloacimonadota bacterium]